MLWKKPAKMTYCDMCIWIDKSGVIPRIAENPGKYPKDEDLVYNYLWLVCRMLAPKKASMPEFKDYDPLAFYAAEFYYFQLIKNYNNRGKSVKGRIKAPIKNILDYIKGTLHHRRSEYQHLYYNERSPKPDDNESKFDSYQYTSNLLDSARNDCFREETLQRIKSSLSPQQIITLLNEFMESTPFKRGSTDWYNFKNTILLNTLYVLNKKGRLVPYELDSELKVPGWHIPGSISLYTIQLVNEFFNKIRTMIVDWFESTRPDDKLLTTMISTPDGIYEEDSY